MTTRPRFTARLVSHHELAKIMLFRGFTVTDLHAEVARRVKRHNSTNRDTVRCARSTIGHMRAGRRWTCHLVAAGIIEDVLQVPRGQLFVAEVSRVQENDRTAQAGFVNLMTTIYGLIIAAAVITGVAFLMAEVESLVTYLEDLGAATGQVIGGWLS